MRHHAVLFDLDGTLADTLRDIAAAANHALAQLGQPVRPVQEYRRRLVGQGLEWMMRTALGPDQAHLVEQGKQFFRNYYAQHNMDCTAPYKGIPELLDELLRRGVKLAVLSNKPDAATQQLMAQAFARWRFDAVRGHRDGAALKPDPASALEIARELDIPPQRWLYIGDTGIDMLTANSAGMFAVGALWGFREEPELVQHGAKKIIAHPREVVELL